MILIHQLLIFIQLNHLKNEFLEKIKGKDIIISIEEHSIIGGLGNVVSDALSNAKFSNTNKIWNK